MLSTIPEQNMEITINATSAIIPRMEDTNSNFLHPSALLLNYLNLLCAFQYWISLWYASSSPSVIMCSMTPFPLNQLLLMMAVGLLHCWEGLGLHTSLMVSSHTPVLHLAVYLGPGPLYCPAAHPFRPVDN